MKTIKRYFAYILIILCALMAFGLIHSPKVQSIDSESFSAERVASDIKIISQNPHSFQQPFAKNQLKNYLYQRLDDMGGHPRVLEYKNIAARQEPYIIDIADIYAEFYPIRADSSTYEPDSYLLLVAHYDSRFMTVVNGKEEWSLGAADDGYGLSVSLESVSQALKYRKDWKQGIKILFTDAEENHCDGVRNAIEYDNWVFDDVGLVMNLEACGVRGPVLLFETSENNSKIIDLYKQTEYPHAYSLTSVIYSYLPYFTDYTYLKKELIPGVNFANLVNSDYYHNANDNYSNINLKTLQHYGSQTEPIIKEYLTNDKYSDSNYLKKSEESIYFSHPWGIITFKKQSWNLVNAIIFAIFCFSLVFMILSRHIRLKSLGRSILSVLLTTIIILLLGQGIGYLAHLIPASVLYVKDIIASFSVLIVLIYVMSRSKIKIRKNQDQYLKEKGFAVMIFMLVFSAIMFFTIGDDFIFIFTVGITALALFLYLFVYLNSLSLVALLIIEWIACIVLFDTYHALTIVDLGIILVMVYYYIILISVLFRCYMYQKRN
ncbi:MAG: M28 family peptidase [Bacteroidales bacterium]